MTIKQYGGVFGRNPTFNDVTIEGQLTFDGDIDINSDLKVSGDIETTGNVIIATSGNGIDFSATAGTGTSELLDDYEEGTWIPAYTGSSGSASYNVQSGTYTKVGREVTVIGELQAGRNTLTGNITISGLPFASSGNGGGMLVTFAILFDTDMPNLRGYATSTSLSLRKQATNASGSTSVTASDLSIAAINHNYLYFSATYFTT